MSIEALIFDVDGTMADTEEAHRTAFNLAFGQFRLGWKWSRSEYRELLRTNGGKERLAAYIAGLSLSPAERKRCTDLLPEIHAEKTRFYSSVVSDGAVPLRDGVERLLDEALTAGCRLAIASTTTAVNVDALLQSTLGRRGLEVFTSSPVATRRAPRSRRPTSIGSPCGTWASKRVRRWPSRIRPTACAPPWRPACGPWSRRPSGPRAATSALQDWCCPAWETQRLHFK